MALLDGRFEGHLVNLRHSPGRDDLVDDKARRLLVISAVVLGVSHDPLGLDALDICGSQGCSEVRVFPVGLKSPPALRQSVEVQFWALDYVDALAACLLALDLAVTVGERGVETGGYPE